MSTSDKPDGQTPLHARHARFQAAALGAGAIAAVVGAWFLDAWVSGSMAERGVTSITVKTNAALSLLLAGLALMLLVPERAGPVRQWLGRLCATAVFLLGVLTFSEHLFGWDLGIDQLLAKEPSGAMGVLHPNRMGPSVSLSFVLAGLALLVLSRCGKRTCLLAQSLASGVCLIALLGIIGYLYDVQQLYDLVRYTTIAWSTAVTLLLLGVGLLCVRPDKGLMTLVTAEDPGGVLVRHLLPPTLVLAVLLGLLELYGEQRGLYDTATGTALLVLGFLVCFTGLLYYGGVRLSRTAMAERAAQERLRLALTASDMGWWHWDFTTDLLDGDARARQLVGLPVDEPIQSIGRVMERTHREDWSRLQQRIVELKTRPGDYEVEFRVTWPDGSLHWILAKGRSLDASGGKPLRAMGTAMDITSRKLAEEQLRQVAQFPEENPNPVLRVSNDGKVLFANRAALAKLTAIGWHADQLVPAPFLPSLQRAQQAGRIIEEEITCDQGKIYLFSVTPIPDAGYINLYGREVTEQKRAEATLRESELFFRQMLESIPGMVFTTRPDGYCDYQSQPWVDYTGVPMSEHLGDGWNRLLHPDDRPRAFAAWQAAVEERAPYDLEYRVRRHDGQYEWFKVIGRPIRDAAGEIVRWFGVALNIEDLKRTEESLKAAKDSAERAKAVAEQANRAKDHFLAVLSHELRTPLTPVVMGVSMLQDRPDLAPEMRETLETVRRHVEMEARLIDDLLDVTRIARGKIELNRKPVELCTVIQRAVEVCKPDIETRGLHFGVDLGPAAPYWVEADEPRLQQVFWNLLKNAIKFTPHGGCVGIRCRPNERHLVVEVNDSGIGIEPESLARVFNAFEQGERSITQQFGGLGLGLAICKALVELHGGRIEAHSEGRGKGATFRLQLPLITPAGRSQMPTPATAPQRVVRPLRILLVEDHGVTAQMMRMVMAAEGHTIETAGDVATALELADQHAFDLLVSDLGLPDGSGHDLMRHLRERGHPFPGIALSGYGQEEDVRRSYEAGFATHLTKPASREAVVEAIAAV
ncbi:MAG: PAS domain-containing protein, partial [Thermoguttaceae bacterium]